MWIPYADCCAAALFSLASVDPFSAKQHRRLIQLVNWEIEVLEAAAGAVGPLEQDAEDAADCHKRIHTVIFPPRHVSHLRHTQLESANLTQTLQYLPNQLRDEDWKDRRALNWYRWAMAEARAGRLDSANGHLIEAAKGYRELGKTRDESCMVSAQGILKHRQVCHVDTSVSFPHQVVLMLPSMSTVRGNWRTQLGSSKVRRS